MAEATIEERQEIYIGLTEMGWSNEECVAVTGIESSIGPDGRECRIVDLVPTVGGMH